MSTTLTVALISDVFFAADGVERLRERLRDARMNGAELVLLPELPLNRWSPATPNIDAADAEAPNGPRAEILRCAARDAGVATLGGVIQRDPVTGRRHNTALLIDARGTVINSYRKLHLPEEAGFHETHHYEPGDAAPDVIRALAMPVGVQICSDTNRPLGSYVLASRGAEAVLIPRATEAATFDRWRLVFQANALVSASYVLSVNRPAMEQGVALGGPSIVVSPHGDVMLETTDTVAFATLDREAVATARRMYPGYLPWRFDIWSAH